MERIIGEFNGKKKGPLVICIGGIHGNELAGIKALDLTIKMLEVEPITNPNFVFRGKLIAMRGNLSALSTGQRYIHKDLNRNFIKERIDPILAGDREPETVEDIEVVELITAVKKEINAYKPEKVIFIDLHTTSSPGGIFTIVPEDEESLKIAAGMHAPVVRGMAEGVKGTTMHYFTTENLGLPSLTISFESGQHEDPRAVNIAIAAVVACLRALDCVDAQDVESLHDEILIDYSRKLPNITSLIMKHGVTQGDGFKMRPNYLNFQEVSKGEVIADDNNGPISIQEDGLLLMPLYQNQGEDGFFLIKTVEEYEFHK